MRLWRCSCAGAYTPRRCGKVQHQRAVRVVTPGTPGKDDRVFGKHLGRFMHLQKLLKEPKTVLLRPMPVEVDGDVQRPVDHPWHITAETSEPRMIRLSCPSLNYSKAVDSTVIVNYIRERRSGGVQ